MLSEQKKEEQREEKWADISDKVDELEIPGYLKERVESLLSDHTGEIEGMWEQDDLDAYADYKYEQNKEDD